MGGGSKRARRPSFITASFPSLTSSPSHVDHPPRSPISGRHLTPSVESHGCILSLLALQVRPGTTALSCLLARRELVQPVDLDAPCQLAVSLVPASPLTASVCHPADTGSEIYGHLSADSSFGGQSALLARCCGPSHAASDELRAHLLSAPYAFPSPAIYNALLPSRGDPSPTITPITNSTPFYKPINSRHDLAPRQARPRLGTSALGHGPSSTSPPLLLPANGGHDSS